MHEWSCTPPSTYVDLCLDVSESSMRTKRVTHTHTHMHTNVSRQRLTFFTHGRWHFTRIGHARRTKLAAVHDFDRKGHGELFDHLLDHIPVDTKVRKTTVRIARW